MILKILILLKLILIIGEKKLFSYDAFNQVLTKSQIIIIREVVDDTHVETSQFIISKIFDLGKFNLKISDDNLIFTKIDSKIKCNINDYFNF